MARPQTITDDEVLAAARAVFLEKGITATVEEVATRCHVGEATVFRRFPTKQALFVAAMDTEREPAWARTFVESFRDDARNGRGDIRGTLTALAHDILASGRKMMPLVLMKMSNPGLWMRPEKPPARVVRALEILTAFFADQIQMGHVKLRDPTIAARIWMGALQHWVMFETSMKPVDGVPVEAFVDELVDLFCSAPSAPSEHGKGCKA